MNEIEETEERPLEIMTIKEAAAYLRLSVPKIYEKVKDREIGVYKTAKCLLFRKSDLDRWLETFYVAPKRMTVKKHHRTGQPSKGLAEWRKERQQREKRKQNKK
jgi:excisionase family DNA binding protein